MVYFKYLAIRYHQKAPSHMFDWILNTPLIIIVVLDWHCVKNVLIRSFSGAYFPAFGLNTEKYGLFLRIQSECRKIRARKTPNANTFHAVWTSVSHASMSWTGFYDLSNFVFCLPLFQISYYSTLCFINSSSS